MALKDPKPGLRRLVYDARSAARVQVTVQPGDVLEVSDDVADQLQASSSQFKDATAPTPEPVKKVAAKKTAAKKS